MALCYDPGFGNRRNRSASLPRITSPDLTGRTLGHYEVLDRIGHGGMGVVYEARDLKLKRKVALKVLQPEFALDPSRLSRFQREAESLAALDHPHIVTIYSVEEIDAVHFLTMALVEGRTLDRVIPRNGMELSGFFKIALPICDALAAAHGKHVIHRDLKPGNIMVSDQGRVLVLDFGLAKLKHEAGTRGASTATTLELTGKHHIVGTTHYMSPEQAGGGDVDHRSDIFSLGIVLYQMLTGRRPFHGDSSTSVTSSIIHQKATPVTELRPDLPRHLGRILALCLSKEREQRYQLMADVRIELQQLQRELDAGDELVTGSTPMGHPHPRRSRLPPAAWLAVGGLLAVAAWWILRGQMAPPARSPGMRSFEMTRITDRRGPELFPSLSPDGSLLVYAARDGGDWDIHFQRVGGRTRINLTSDSETDDTQPALSPDGKQIAFRSERDGGGIFTMGATGENVRRATDFGFNPAWHPDGSALVFATEPVVGPMERASVSELWMTRLDTLDTIELSAGDAVQPSVSPSGRRVAYWAIAELGGERDIFTMPLSGGAPRQLTSGPSVDWHPVWAPDGRHLYFCSDRGGAMNLWRIGVDEASGRARGEPQPITSGLASTTQHFAVARSGESLALVSRVTTKNLSRVALDPPTGRVDGPAEIITAGSLQAHSPDPSPDGQWVAFNSWAGQEDVYLLHLGSGELRQLTNDPHKDRSPRWAPDGSRIAFYSDRGGGYDVWAIRPDGSGLEQLTDLPGTAFAVWSPDGSKMAFPNINLGPAIIDLHVPLGERVPSPLPAMSDPDEMLMVWSWSPDGRRLAGHHRLADGRNAGIAFFDLETRSYVHLTTDGGELPVWLDADRRLLYWRAGEIRMVDSHTGETRSVFSIPDVELDRFFGYSRRERRLYVAQVANEADIWMLDLQ